MFGRNKTHLEQALKAQESALKQVEGIIDSMRVYAISAGTKLSAEDKCRISTLVSAMMIAEENVRVALGRPHTFAIRSLYAPVDPEDTTDFARKVKAHLFGSEGA